MIFDFMRSNISSDVARRPVKPQIPHITVFPPSNVLLSCCANCITMELREELIAKGHVMSSCADTEVLLHGYEEYCVSSFKCVAFLLR